ncbi:MAG: TonB-dependent receptor [Rhodospirillaceae bacterium]|nr:TonB-dependent receptor [Rhodospirillaceae bacterium]
MAFLTTTGLTIIGLNGAGVAYAQSSAIRTALPYHIEPQALESALRQFANQSNLQLLFSQDDVVGKTSPGITGSYTPDAAVKRLLIGTGLVFEVIRTDAVLIKRVPSRRALDDTDRQRTLRVVKGADARLESRVVDQPHGLDEIIVSARRVQENIQAVPISITAFLPEMLRLNDIRSLTDLQRSIPGLQACCGPALSTNSNLIYLRGIPGVVGYFAEVPTPLNGHGLYLDLTGIQALRGPQGTLFGLSTDGGALIYEPRRPSADAEGFAEVTFGDYGRRGFEGAFNIPLASDKVLTRAALMASHTNGYLRSIATNQDLGDESYAGGRFSVIWRPSDSFENYSVFNYYSSHGSPLPAILTAVNPDGPAAAAFGLSALNDALAMQQQLGFYRIAGLSVSETRARTAQYHLINIGTWSLAENANLKSISGYVVNSTFLRQDIEGTYFTIADTPQPDRAEPSSTPTWSQEVQLQGRMADKKLSYTVGTFHTGSVTRGAPTEQIFLGVARQTFTKSAGKTHAVYAQADLDLSDWFDDLILTAGYRYTWDERHLRQIRRMNGAVSSDSGPLEGHFRAGSYALSLTYRVAEDTRLFITNSKGYSSGGFNPTAPAELQRYNPESLNNIEAGIKSDWTFGGIRARTNLSAYYAFYNDVQVTTTQRVRTSSGPVLAVVIDNAGKAHLSGIEGDATFILSPELEVFGNFSYFRNVYDTYMTLSASGAPVDNSGLGFSYAPRWKYSVGGSYRLPVDAALGKISVNALWSWQSSVLTQPILNPRPVDGIPHFGHLNLALDWTDFAGVPGFGATIFATNVNQNHWTQGGFGAYEAIGIAGRYGDQPRMLGARLSYRF